MPGDVYTEAPPEQLGLAYHAYSASGDVTAPVVYAGSGNPEDYDRLEAHGNRRSRAPSLSSAIRCRTATEDSRR